MMVLKQCSYEQVTDQLSCKQRQAHEQGIKQR
jgi:hypothetical protein